VKGRLLVITGFSGAGKDSVIEKLFEKMPEFRRLVTCADRPPRPGEVHGVHYYFVSSEELDIMHKKGELVEAPLLYGTSRKATPKSEFKKIINEKASLVWRIESSLAAFVASGKFFDEQFAPEESAVLKSLTTTVFLTAKRPQLRRRRRLRDGPNYNPREFTKRDSQDELILAKYGKVFKNVIENRENEIEETVTEIAKLLEI
jgi:guanylate kinase